MIANTARTVRYCRSQPFSKLNAAAIWILVIKSFLMGYRDILEAGTIFDGVRDALNRECHQTRVLCLKTF